MKFREGETYDIFLKNTFFKIGEIKIKEDCCEKMFARQVLSMLDLVPSEYYHKLNQDKYRR